MLWQTYGFAQIDTSTLLGSIHYSFSKLDSADVPTHILIDRTLPLGHEEYFTGNGDSLCTIKRYKQIYLDIFNASYNSFLQLPDLDTLYQRASVYLDDGVFPISISKFDYNNIRAEALDSGWMDYDSLEQRYVDVAGKNPYASASVCVAAVFNPVTWQGLVTFILAGNLLFTNGDINTDSVEIDFGDGTGYHLISVGQTINIDYSEFEDGSIITIRVRVKSGDAILLSNTEFIIAEANGSNPDAYININDAFRSTYNMCNLNNR